MSNGWDTAQGLADKHSSSGSGLYVRLANDRDKIVGAFTGEPYARETHWSGERYEECSGDSCSHCIWRHAMVRLSRGAETLLTHCVGLTCCGSSLPPMQREPGWRMGGLLGAKDRERGEELCAAGLARFGSTDDHGGIYIGITEEGLQWAREWQRKRREAHRLRRYDVWYVDEYGERTEMRGGFYRSRAAARFDAAVDLAEVFSCPIFPVLRGVRARLSVSARATDTSAAEIPF